jgi:hypothetical protein
VQHAVHVGVVERHSLRYLRHKRTYPRCELREMTGMPDSTRRAREIEAAVRVASERYRARRADIDAVESRANVWFGGEQVARGGYEDGAERQAAPPRHSAPDRFTRRGRLGANAFSA